MGNSLWPSFANMSAPRGMRQMLSEAAGDLSAETNGKLEFYVDSVGVGASGRIQRIRYNCYINVIKSNKPVYHHLFFRVTTPVASPFPATLETPEGDEEPDLKDEPELRDAIKRIMERERTTEVVLYLMNSV